jgi:hypothetical protein
MPWGRASEDDDFVLHAIHAKRFPVAQVVCTPHRGYVFSGLRHPTAGIGDGSLRLRNDVDGFGSDALKGWSAHTHLVWSNPRSVGRLHGTRRTPATGWSTSSGTDASLV